MKLLLVPLFATIVIAGAVPAAAGTPPGVVLHIETGPGAFSPEGPEVTVHADGRVFIDRA
jgi:hypothetical protein